MDIITVKSEPRTPGGSKTARSLRAQGRLPVIIYGHNEPPEAISLAQHDVEVALGHGARTLNVEVGGRVSPYLIKDVQYDYLAATPIHMDLARVDLSERVRVTVGIELRGIPKGVQEGGVIDQSMAEIEVECLVTDIPDTLRPVVTHLVLGDTLLVKDLPLPPGVKALAGPDERVATVRAMMEEPVAAPAPVEAEGAPLEPERIGRIRKEEPTEEGA